MRRPLSVLIAATVVLVACDASDETVSPASTPTDSTVGDTVAPGTAAVTQAPNSSTPNSSGPAASSTVASVPSSNQQAELCAATDIRVDGRLTSAQLDEASGLVSSRRHDDVLWLHNDGNEIPGLFAVGTDGADLGFHPLEIDGVVDVEDIALQPGGDADRILLADIGDNSEQRSTVRVYRFPEPDPAVPGPLRDVEVLEFAYPDRAYNAEVLLVDDDANTIVIVTKQQERVDGIPRDLGPTAPSPIFEGSLDGHGAGPVTLQQRGVLDAPALAMRTTASAAHPTSIIGIGGLPTGGDVSPDGELVVVRTYETAWVWPRTTGQRVVEVFEIDPCQVMVAPERQGEAIGFDGSDLVSVSEGSGAPVNRVVP